MTKRSIGLFVWAVAAGPGLGWAQLPPAPDKPGAKSKPEPRLFIEKRTHELGTILEGDIVTVSWKLENRGDADLVIDRTAAACGCTVVKLRDEDKVVRPGGGLDLKVEFNSTGRGGEQNKEITVFSNDPLEPELKLSFHAHVDMLYIADPATVVNLRVLRRGETAQKPLELLPTEGKGDLEVTKLMLDEGAPFEARVEPYSKSNLKGARVQFAILDSAALGPVAGSAVVNVRVGEVEREKTFSVRGEIVADLTWLPKVVDTTRQPSVPGKVLSSITLSSTDDRPFKILEAKAGPLLDVTVGPGKKGKPGTQYDVQVTVDDAAPAGPFGTNLVITTDLLDQPVVEVPVFGIVAPKVEIDPPVVLLRKDNTEAGAKRRLRVKTSNVTPLNISHVECDSPAVSVQIDRDSSAKYKHLVYVDIRLTGALPAGTHTSVIRLATDVAGAETIAVPVRIEVP